MGLKQPVELDSATNSKRVKRFDGTRILVIDPQPLFRDGLCAALADLGSGTTILAVADLAEALDRIPPGAGVDIVLADLCPASDHGRRDIQEVRTRFGGTPLILLLRTADRTHTLKALDLRVRGCLSKCAEATVALEAVRQVLSGGSYYPSELLDEAPALPPRLVRTNGRGRPSRLEATGNLTPRQSQVLVLLREGKSNREIAKALAISEGTVKIHVTAILRCLGVRNRIQAVISTTSRAEGEGEELVRIAS